MAIARWLILIACLPSALAAEEPAPESRSSSLASLRFQFRVKVEVLGKPEEALGEKYEAQLTALEPKLGRKGDLDQIRALREELKHYRSDARTEIPANFRELKRLRDLYESAAEKAATKRRAGESQLRQEYENGLRKLMDSLSRKGRLDEALALQNELERVKKRTALGHSLNAILQGGTADHLFDPDDASKLGSGWKWHEHKPEATMIENGVLALRNLGGTTWMDSNNMVNLPYLPLPKDAKQLAVNVDFKPENPYDSSGLMIFADQDNYVRIATGLSREGTLEISFARESGGRYTTHGEREIESGASRIRLGIDPETRSFTASYRPAAGGDWTEIGIAESVRGKELSLAVYCHQGNMTPANTCSAKFSLLEID